MSAERVQSGRETLRAVALSGVGIDVAVLNQVLGSRGFAPVILVSSLADLIGQLRAVSPQIVVVPVPNGVDNADVSVLQTELRRHPGTAAIGVAPVKDADTVLMAMRIGLLEFVTAPVVAAELAIAVQRLLKHLGTASSGGRLIAVHSAKGGVGVTTVALSLAWSLAHQAARPRVALIDFSTLGTGVRVTLDLSPAYDLGRITSRVGSLDAEFVRSCMVAHEEGVSILTAADDIDAVDVLDATAAARLLDVLRAEFDFVVIDTDHHLADQTLAALDAADRVVLVGHGDIVSVRSAQRSLALGARLGYAQDKTVLVLNRKNEQQTIAAPDAERVLGRAISAQIPDDIRGCGDAVAFGQFPQQRQPASPFALAVDALAGILIGAAYVRASDGERGGKRGIGRLFGKR